MCIGTEPDDQFLPLAVPNSPVRTQTARRRQLTIKMQDQTSVLLKVTR